MKHKLINFLMLLLIIKLAYGSSIDITAPSLIIQGEPETANIMVTAESLFDGNVQFSYGNIDSAAAIINFNAADFIGSGPYYYNYYYC